MPSVAILLCTFNGAGFLPAQLSSYTDQLLADWRIYASDDGSSDETCAILSEFQRRLGPSRMEMRDGPRGGYVANFLSLACDPSIGADYYAFSDQDDIWESEKLSRAVNWLQSASSQVPAVYCSRTRLIDENGREYGFSPLFRRKPDFKNALVQSIAGGNTMVFNRAAKISLNGRRLRRSRSVARLVAISFSHRVRRPGLLRPDPLGSLSRSSKKRHRPK